MEALALIATNYNFMHKYLDDTSYTRSNLEGRSDSSLQILQRIGEDKRLDGIFEHPGADNLETLFACQEVVVLEYWNSWNLNDPQKQFEDSQHTAAYLLAATPIHDFFLVHVLTSSHAVRILLPFVPQEKHVSLLRQWWLLAVVVYIAQLRPKINTDSVKDYDSQGRDWTWIEGTSLQGQWCHDAHFVKALRAIKEAASTWGDPEMTWLKCALKVADQFRGWSGFGP